MSKVLIIGAGGVGTVVAHKVAQNTDVFTEIMLASRTKSKCDRIAEDILKRYNVKIQTAQVDADNVEDLVALFKSFGPKIVINVALPYQDLTIMEACLQAGCNYLDTANYEPKDEAHFEYSWQWAYTTVSKKQASALSSVAVSTQVALLFTLPMLLNTTSTKCTISTSSTATLATTTKHSLLTSTQKSTFAKSLKTDATGKMDNGLLLVHSNSTNLSHTQKSVPANHISSTTKSWNHLLKTSQLSNVLASG